PGRIVVHKMSNPVRTNKPAPIKWIIALAWIRLAFLILASVLSIAFVSPIQSEVGRGFREGWIGAAGYAPEHYGPQEAANFVGRVSISTILTILLLVF